MAEILDNATSSSSALTGEAAAPQISRNRSPETNKNSVTRQFTASTAPLETQSRWSQSSLGTMMHLFRVHLRKTITVNFSDNL